MIRQSAFRNPQSAILLLGPTGSGKTPLGVCLEARGLWGRRCVHVDFGACLRAAVADGDGALDPGERAEVQAVLRANRLLEDHQFPIACKILDAFLTRASAGAKALIVLNGLPRHEGQALALEPLVRVIEVVELVCEAAVVHARIAANAGGDRAGRRDDSREEIERKLALYAARTAPLLDHYRKKGVSLHTVPVTLFTQSEDVWRALEAFPPVKDQYL